jgi:hypothetical protein
MASLSIEARCDGMRSARSPVERVEAIAKTRVWLARVTSGRRQKLLDGRPEWRRYFLECIADRWVANLPHLTCFRLTVRPR